jgi:hypothetical protein
VVTIVTSSNRYEKFSFNAQHEVDVPTRLLKLILEFCTSCLMSRSDRTKTSYHERQQTDHAHCRKH